MANTYFQVAHESASSGEYGAEVHTAGPWDVGMQHGGPPNALLVHAAERLVLAETGRDDLVATRLAAEFIGPVPVAQVTTSARVVRAARSAVLVEAGLATEGRACVQARVWFVRAADTSSVAADLPAPSGPPDGLPGLGVRFPYGETIEWRTESGAFADPGPAVVWARPTLELITGRPMSALGRAVLIGDSASGVSAELDWSAWSFLNVDLDVHLARPVQGEWIRMAARTLLGPGGVGLARSTLSDARGEVGSTAQTLVLAPARR